MPDFNDINNITPPVFATTLGSMVRCTLLSSYILLQTQSKYMCIYVVVHVKCFELLLFALASLLNFFTFSFGHSVYDVKTCLSHVLTFSCCTNFTFR